MQVPTAALPTDAFLPTDAPLAHTSTPTYTFHHAVHAHRNGEPLSQVTQRLLAELSRAERLRLLDGDVPFYAGLRDILLDRYNRVPFVMGAIPRLEIPGVRFTDGPRGVVMGASTAFPVSMARGATWDVALERRVGEAIGLEAKAQGANFFAGVCINLPRHPAWGRVQETYGEDPMLLGEFGRALAQGVQQHIMACAKHFALNSMENARFRVDVRVDDAVLHEVYLPHFRRVVEGGVAAVMSAYNAVNGEWAGQSQLLLTDVLRRQYGFDGFVLSDFIFGLRDAARSLRNGLDIEAPFAQQRAMHLGRALESGALDWATVDQASARILRTQLAFAASTAASAPDPSVVFCAQHRALAREVAARAVVLLKNDRVDDAPALLPLDAARIASIAVVGRLANVANTGDKGSSQVFAPQVVTPVAGLRAAFPDANIMLDDTDSAARAADLAAAADLAVCVVGYNAADEGEYVVPSLQTDAGLLDLLPPAHTADEQHTLAIIKGDTAGGRQDSALEVGAGGDRRSLRLRTQDLELIAAVTAANPRTVVAVVAGGAVLMEEWVGQVPALVMAWYAGAEGGHGLADVLLGRVDASGRLPFSIPRDESHLPSFDIDATEIEYDRWHGQNLLDKLGEEARFPLGFGLSYTSFAVSDLRIGPRGGGLVDTIPIRVRVANVGGRHGRHVIQVYGRAEMPDFPSCVLLGFLPVDLDAGQIQDVALDVSARPLQRWRAGEFVLPGKEVTIEVAAFAGDTKAVRATTVL